MSEEGAIKPEEKTEYNIESEIEKNQESKQIKDSFEKKWLYSFIKSNKNIPMLNELKEQFTIEDLQKITIFNKSLIYWAVVLEHEKLIDELFSINLFNKKEFLSEIFSFNVTNKNPIILKKIMNEISKLPIEEQKLIFLEHIDKISTNCFRLENILIIENHIFNQFNKKEKNDLIQRAVINNNLSLINILNIFDKWHDVIISNKEEIISKVHKPYLETYKKIIKQTTEIYLYNHNKTESIHFQLEKKSKNNVENKSITIPTVIKKKRKIFS